TTPHAFSTSGTTAGRQRLRRRGGRKLDCSNHYETRQGKKIRRAKRNGPSAHEGSVGSRDSDRVGHARPAFQPHQPCRRRECFRGSWLDGFATKYSGEDYAGSCPSISSG